MVERDTGMSGKTERDSEVADGRKQAADTAADGELRAADSVQRSSKEQKRRRKAC